MSKEGTDTVLVWGIINEDTIDGSSRTFSPVIEPDKFLKKVFGRNKEDKYYGGGNTKNKGRFQISLGFFTEYPNKELLYKIVKEIVEQKFYERIEKEKTVEESSA